MVRVSERFKYGFERGVGHMCHSRDEMLFVGDVVGPFLHLIGTCKGGFEFDTCD